MCIFGGSVFGIYKYIIAHEFSSEDFQLGELTYRINSRDFFVQELKKASLDIASFRVMNRNTVKQYAIECLNNGEINRNERAFYNLIYLLKATFPVLDEYFELKYLDTDFPKLYLTSPAVRLIFKAKSSSLDVFIVDKNRPINDEVIEKVKCLKNGEAAYFLFRDRGCHDSPAVVFRNRGDYQVFVTDSIGTIPVRGGEFDMIPLATYEDRIIAQLAHKDSSIKTQVKFFVLDNVRQKDSVNCLAFAIHDLIMINRHSKDILEFIKNLDSHEEQIDASRSIRHFYHLPHYMQKGIQGAPFNFKNSLSQEDALLLMRKQEKYIKKMSNSREVNTWANKRFVKHVITVINDVIQEDLVTVDASERD